MKVKYTNGNGRIVVELEGETQVEIVERLAAFQEIFDESSCGKMSKRKSSFYRKKRGRQYVLRT